MKKRWKSAGVDLPVDVPDDVLAEVFAAMYLANDLWSGKLFVRTFFFVLELGSAENAHGSSGSSGLHRTV